MTIQNLLGKFILNAKVSAVTGLHIGGSAAGLEIGAVDNPVIKDPLTDKPYIPGSSLKGKLRSMAEWYFGLIEKHPKHKSYQAYDCAELAKSKPQSEGSKEYQRWQAAYTVGRLFGAASDDPDIRLTCGPSRLTVRDACLTPESEQYLQRVLGEGVFTEIKTENALDRVTSEANPRPIERVPAGAEFDLTLIVDIYQPQDVQLLRDLFTFLNLVEQSSLGGGGSRGSGQIKFMDWNVRWRAAADYRNGTPGIAVELPGSSLDEVLQRYDQIPFPTIG
jgi:CRISPR-associated protein Csm3